MPQSSRMIVMFWACFSQALTSLADGPWAAQARHDRAAARISFFMTPYNSAVMKIALASMTLALLATQGVQ